MANGVTVLPGAGQRATAPLADLGQNLLQFFLQREQLQMQEQEQKLAERQVKLQEQQAQRQAQQAAGQEAAGQAQLALLLQQNPQLAQTLGQQFPGAQAAAGPAQLQPSGRFGAAPTQFDPSQLPAGAAAPIAAGVQQQQQFQAQQQQLAAATEAQRAATEARQAETQLAQNRLEFEESISGLRRDELQAQIEATRATSAAQRAQAQAAQARIQQGYIELGVGMADQIQSRFATVFSNLASATGDTSGARAIASDIVFGTPRPPTGEQLGQQLGSRIQQLASASASPEQVGELVGSTLFTDAATQTARRLNVGPTTQVAYDAAIAAAENPAAAFRDVVAQIDAREGQNLPGTQIPITEEVLNSQKAAAKIYFEFVTGRKLRVPQESKNWFRNLLDFLSSNFQQLPAASAAPGVVRAQRQR